MKLNAAWISSAALAALLAGCAADSVPLVKPTEAPVDVLAGVNWHLTAYGPRSAPVTLIPGTDSTLLLNSSTRQVSGLAGCNRFSGSYALSGDKITLGQLAMTKRLCVEPEGLAAQESAVAQALTGAKQYSFEDGDLILTYGADNVLRYSKTGPTRETSPSLAELRRHLGQYPRDINLWSHPLLAQRIHTLLGSRHATFLENIRVQGPLTEENGLLFVTGNKPHQGGVDMAAFIADPVNDKIQIWLSTGGKVENFSEADPPLADPPSVATFKSNLAPKP
jgi:heat shock protein HslJ